MLCGVSSLTNVSSSHHDWMQALCNTPLSKSYAAHQKGSAPVAFPNAPQTLVLGPEKGSFESYVAMDRPCENLSVEKGLEYSEMWLLSLSRHKSKGVIWSMKSTLSPLR